MNGLIMKRKTTVFVNLALLALVGSTVLCSKIKSPLAGLSLSGTRKVEVADPQYQMTAYTLEIPGDWKFAGTIARDPGCHAKGASLKYTAQSGDGLTGIVMMPGLTWSWSSSPQMQKIMASTHCPAVDIDSAAAFLINIAVPNLHPEAKVVAVLPLLPEGQASLASQLEKERQQNAVMAQQYGQKPQKLSLDGARVRVQYVRDGKPVEEMLVAVVDCNESTTIALYAQPAAQRRTCSARNIVMTRAPQGHLDEFLDSAQYKDIGKTLQANQEWSTRLMADQKAAFQQFQANNNQQFQRSLDNFKAQGDARLARGQEFNRNLRAGTDRAIAADRQRQAAIDDSAHRTELYSLDQQEFRNPSTGETIRASNQYNHQWLSSDGSTLIQTNDHTYDPNGQVYPVSQSWTELVPK
jgi:hypothetical protein